jgi:plasmid stabilization system protein ParE
MKYTVRLMPRAFADGDRIYLWIAKRSPRGAVAWFEAFLRALDNLSKNPQRFELAYEQHFQGKIRQQLFKTSHGQRYRILFSIAGNQVHVHCVRAPGQSPVKPQDLQ